MKSQHMTWITAATIWMINPVFTGCDVPTHQEDFDFGEAEMLDVLDNMNSTTWTFEINGSNFEVQVDFIQRTGTETASLLPFVDVGSAHACGSRSFLAEAEACMDVTSLPIEGTVSLLSIDTPDEPQVFSVEGSLDVYGNTLSNVDIWVQGDNFNAYWYGSSVGDNPDLVIELNSLDQ